MIFYEDNATKLILDDTFDAMANLASDSFDMVFADPPYFLSNGGISCSGGAMVSVNKGDWDKGLSIESKHEFNRLWIRACRRLLKDAGTIFISGTMHNVYSCGMALEQEGFKILNNITWRKLNPPPNLSCRYFVHSTENIIWAKKNPNSKHVFNYDLMKNLNNGKQMKDVIEGPLTPRRERVYGRHPTQKPEYLLERLILAATNKGDNVLDPFVGSGTTCVVAKRLGRCSTGIDSSIEYLGIARRRVESI